MRALAAVLGVLAIAVGAAAGFSSRSEASTVAIIAADTAFLVIAVVAGRLSELDVGATGIRVKLNIDAKAAGAPTAATEQRTRRQDKGSLVLPPFGGVGIDAWRPPCESLTRYLARLANQLHARSDEPNSNVLTGMVRAM
jgi:hypothetical protein